MRHLKEGEYITTLKEYHKDSNMSYRDIADSCPKCTKQNIFLAIKSYEKGARESRSKVMLQVEEDTYSIKWAFTVNPVFGFEND